MYKTKHLEGHDAAGGILRMTTRLLPVPVALLLVFGAASCSPSSPANPAPASKPQAASVPSITATSKTPTKDAKPAKPAKVLPPEALIPLDRLSPAIEKPAISAASFQLGEMVRANVLEAEGLLARGNSQAALALLERAIGFEPENPRIRRDLGMAYAGVGNGGKALESFRLVAAKAPDDLEVQVLLGRLLSGTAEQSTGAAGEQAVLAFRTALRTSACKPSEPLAAEALLRLAMLLEKRGYYTAAMECFARLEQWIERHERAYLSRSVLKDLIVHPERLLMSRGRLLLFLDRPRDAARVLEQAHHLDRTDTLVAGLLAKAYIAAGDDARAQQLLVELAGEPSQRWQLLSSISLLVAHATREGKSEAALDFIARMLQAKPDLSMNFRPEMQKLSAVLPPDIEEGYARGIDSRDEGLRPSRHYVCGMLAMVREKRAIALQEFRKSLQAGANFYPAYEALLDLYLLQGRADQVKQLLTQAEKNAPEYFLSYLQGKICVAQGESEKALTQLEQARQQNPDHLPTLLMLGEISFRLGKKHEAEEWLKEALATAPDEPLVYRRLFAVYVSQGRLEQGRMLAERLLDRDPQSVPARSMLVEYYVSSNRPQDAEKLFRQLEASAPDDADVKVLGVTLAISRLGSSDEGQPLKLTPDDVRKYVDVLNEAIVLDPTNAPAKAMLWQLLAGAGLAKDETAAIWGRLYAKTGQQADVGRYYAEALLEAKGYPAAVKVLSQLLVRSGKDLKLRLALLQACQKGAMVDEAKSYVEQWVAQAENPEESSRYRYALLLVYAENKRYEQAHALLDELIAAMQQDPGVSELRLTKVQLYNEEGQFDKAIDYASRWVQDEPDSSVPRHILVSVYSGAGRYRQAVDKADEFLRANPKDPELLGAKSSCLLELGQEKEALALLEKAYGEQPEEPGLCNNLGYLYADKGINLDKAERMIRTALAAKPGNSPVIDSLAWIFYKQGKFAEALRTISPLIREEEARPYNAVIYDHAGDICYRLSRKQLADSAAATGITRQELADAAGENEKKALRCWKKALELAGQNKVLTMELRKVLADVPGKAAALTAHRAPGVAPLGAAPAKSPDSGKSGPAASQPVVIPLQKNKP